MARPKYEVLQKCFIAPHTLLPGAIITMIGEPADHLKPLNAEAEAAMELWYTKTYEYIDERTGQLVRKQPNLSKRAVEVAARTGQTVVQLHAVPSAKDIGVVVGEISRELQPDLVVNPGEMEEEEEPSVESFDGTMTIESNPPSSRKAS